MFHFKGIHYNSIFEPCQGENVGDMFVVGGGVGCKHLMCWSDLYIAKGSLHKAYVE